MNTVEELIVCNEKKLGYLKNCLDANRQAEILVEKANVNSLFELANKKKSLITSINVIDDRIVSLVSRLREERGVDSLADIIAGGDATIVELRRISVEVVEQMANLKQSDDAIMKRLEELFDNYKNSHSSADQKKLEYFTTNYFSE